MPRIDTIDDSEIKLQAGTFTFSAIKPENLGASEYTLVTICMDRSGSVQDFEQSLMDSLKSILDACRKSPRVDNLMIRYVIFNNDINEVHGFKEFSSISYSDYGRLNAQGMTSLFDATANCIESTISYSEMLMKSGFNVNGAVYIITDGLDNTSTLTPDYVKDLVKKSLDGEKIESLITILIGLTSSQEIIQALKDFQTKAKLTQFVEVGNATPQRLAKLADFVSKSISSQSNSLNSGKASTPINVTF